jgi:uncharacterized protein (DUF433 family)
MIAQEPELTPTQAAVVSCVTVRNVNRCIDEKILPKNLFEIDGDGARRLSVNACIFISFYFEAANRLTSEERRRIIASASRELPKANPGALEKEWIIRQEFLSVDLAPFLRGVRLRLAQLDAALALVVEDPEILSGTPVIRGTRVPVYDIAVLAASGEPVDRILEDFPGITAEAVELAALYAEANPLQGRPQRSRTLPAGAVVVTHYRVPGNRAVIQKLAS